ncbi:uncharacterized protein LOC123015995 isoform X5 [Tribolium madens]|uniref:uncharacterized protein LOC123015995 isoform X5 n=1 Tax=Tribolium madens TaxID=41895 RepID=UPI001CF74440|nr:uncharacterized protein LOC123015995 isoform X5 [Tribolium madens]
MYVISPADEVVCLSYGRVIYIPSSLPTNRVTKPIRTSLSTGSHTSYPSVPSTSTSSTKSRQSTASEPVFSLNKIKPTSSSKSLNQPSTSREKSPNEPPPVRPSRKKKLKVVLESARKQSFSDFLSISRERTPKSPVNQTPEKSPTFQFFRGKSVSPKNLGRNRTAVDFDFLFNREASPGKLSVKSLNNVDETGPKLTGKQRLTPEKSSPTKKRTFFGSVRVKRTPEVIEKMAGYESALKELTHAGYNEHLKSHNSVTFKLVRTVSDFTQQLGQMYEQHAEELQILVANFRKRNGELRKERPACPSSLFHTWETLLQEVEIDSQALGEIASILGRQVSRPLLERSFHRKIQSRKVFTQRESYETIIAKTEEKLVKCRQEYKNAYLAYLSNPTTESLSSYFNSHNTYVQQLHATNGMLEEYGKDTLPSLLQELEDIYSDLCAAVSEAVAQGAEVVSSRAKEQCKRYDGLVSQCKSISASSDLAHLARSLPTPTGRAPILKRPFVPPQPPPPPDPVDGEPQDMQNLQDNIPPPLKDELVIDRLSALQVKPSHDVLKKEAADLEAQIRQIQDALETLLRIQQRSVEAALYNKANELQEDISMKRFDLRVAQIHLSAINAQKELFTSKLEGDTGRERKMSSASTASMKNKWLKAFKSLKTPPPETTEKKNQMYHAVSTIIAMRKNGSAATRELLKGDPDAHNFQEYTYKKITPCDVCSQVLRGHTRQGLKCRICKMNVHLDCQDKASKCQTKQRLLRRQKSTSEIETRIQDVTAEDETPHSPRRQKLNLRMKSLSLDSPESTEHVQRRKHHGVNVASDPHSNQSSSSRIQCMRSLLCAYLVFQNAQLFPNALAIPARSIHSHHVTRSDLKAKSTPSSPVHNRRLLSAKNIRMSSVELPDENDKSPSSASTSPCPSPVGAKKSHRLLPTNLYVVLYNFKSRHQDELDLKAGYKVTVIDTSDPDWWKGKCLGRVGFFPSKYVSKLSPGEKPLQVTHNLQVSDGDNGLMLLRDQIVIQIGEELDGMVMIRSGDNRQGVCPVKFLQEV